MTTELGKIVYSPTETNEHVLVVPGSLPPLPSLPRKRLKSLDALRGIACFIVLVHHCMLCSQTLCAARVDSSDIWWVGLLAYTPLHAIWAGTECVMLFFILSGFVLTHNTDSINWRRYYPTRLIRLYLPSIAAVVYTCLLFLFIGPRTTDTAVSDYVNGHTSPITATDALMDAILIIAQAKFNTSMWSLAWEVWFSLLLPLYIIGLRTHYHNTRLKLFVLVAMSTISQAVSMYHPFYPYLKDALQFMPVFGIGVLIGTEEESIKNWMASERTWTFLFTNICIALMPWMCTFWMQVQLDKLFQLVPLAAVMAWAAFHEDGRQLGESRVLTWLGSRSYSLYLVHAPIVVCTAHNLHTTNPALVMSVAVPIALLTAELFFRCVERPSMALAKFCGQRLK